MNKPFTINIDAWDDGSAIPARFAFGRPGEDAPFAPSDNVSPAITWSNAPTGTQSFAIICCDPDVPFSSEDVNKAGKVVPEDQTRGDFFHWVLIDIPIGISGLDEGAVSMGITPGGKKVGLGDYGVAGKNDYTGWFAGDPEMEGTYGGYDGPCPPWNDSIAHRYYFEVFALDVETLDLRGVFTGQEAREAMKGHILASAVHMGTYSMNPEVNA